MVEEEMLKMVKELVWQLEKPNKEKKFIY